MFALHCSTRFSYQFQFGYLYKSNALILLNSFLVAIVMRIYHGTPFSRILTSCFILEFLMTVATHMQGKLYAIMEICRTFDQIFKEHLDGV